MGFFNQLWLLLWKNYLLRRRQKIWLVCETLFPLALFMILLVVRITKPDLKVKHGACHFDGKAMPSAGVLPFLQSFVCTFNNTCHSTPSGDELTGVAGSFNSAGVGPNIAELRALGLRQNVSINWYMGVCGANYFYWFEGIPMELHTNESHEKLILPRIIEDIEEILSNNVDVELISDILYDANILIDLYPLLLNGNTTGNISLGNSLIDPAKLRQQILDQNLPLNSTVIDWLLDATLNTNQIFQSGVDQRFLIEVIDSFFPDLFVSTNHTIEYVRQEICDKQRLKEIFVFPNDSVSDEVHRELCALSADDFVQLYNVIAQDFNSTVFIQDVQDFVQQNVGQQLTMTLLEQALRLAAELRNNPENLKPFEDLYDTVQDILNQLPQNVANAQSQAQAQSGEMMRMLGSLVCGREGAFFAIDEDQAEQLVNADRQPVNPQLTQKPTTLAPTTPAPRTPGATTTKDPNRISDRAKDKACVRETSQECLDLFEMLRQTGSTTRFLWRQVKPFIRGCILYYPQNNVTEQIVDNAQDFFRDIQRVENVSVLWADFSPQLFNVLNNSEAVEGLRVFVDSGLCTFAESALRNQFTNFNISGDICDFLIQYLDNGPNSTDYDWRDSLEMLDSVFETVSSYLKCFNFDKFVGYTDRAEMMSDGLAMIGDDLFWSAVEFENSDWSSLPTHVTYKIRMDVDKVDGTKRVKDKYPKPGPRRNPWQLKYFMYGFVYIQDMLDHAIIKMQTGMGAEKPGVGIYTQQFPYPCYTEDKYYRPGPRRRPYPDLKYFTFGFVYIQDMLDHGIIKLQTGIGADKPGVGIYTQQIPYPCYTEDKFIYAISRMLPLFMILAWILTTAMLCKSIVFEKERRLKEVMKIMGLGNGVHWMAWFINAFIMMFLTTVLLVIILKAGTILEHSDPSAVLFFMTVFCIATIVKCFLISVFFSRANLAACCAGFIYFLMYLPYMLLLQFDDVLTKEVKKAVALSSNVAFGYGCNFIALWEEQAIGLQWNNMNLSPVTDDNFNMLDCIQMMIVDTILYGVLTWYIEAVFPGQYGIPKPFYFLFTRSYWCGWKYQGDGNTLPDMGIELDVEDKDNIEPVPASRKVGVAIRNLKKMYSGSKKLAVDGLSINFYEGQITSFLGHNGAGKTTTMSILTGLFPPTEGTAYIQGEDIQLHMDQIRHSLGMCPQHNVLFDHLTVEEHLWFYARMKGSTSKEVKDEIEQMLKDVGLPHKRKQISVNLSGGMKRKLSVAIAFVGNSQTVILDEPTAGVDPYARRAIWQLLLKLKKGRTIILSTHHMDEADVLGDRIAIISLGKLCCVGSSLFLKNRYGNGYYLTLVRSDDDAVDEDEILRSQLLQPSERPMSAGSVRTITSVLPKIANDIEDEGYADGKSDSDPPTPPPEGSTYSGFSVKKVTSFVQKFVAKAHLVEDNMTELCYQLPDDAAKTGDFERLFHELEQSHKDLGISSFGISDTSLEEVFLKVAEENSEVDMADETKRHKLDDMGDGGRIPRSVSRLSFRKKKKLSLFGRRKSGRVSSKTDLMEEEDTDSVVSAPASDYGENGFSHNLHTLSTGWRLILRQFAAIFLKRFHHVRRSKKGVLVEVVLPVLFVLLAMIFTLLAPPFTEEPPLELHPWLYEPVRGDKWLYMFYSNDEQISPLTQAFEETIQARYGVGNRCVNKHHIDDYPCEPQHPQMFLQSVLVNDTTQCDCSTGWQRCPDGAGGPAPPQVTLSTTDRLQNMTKRGISNFLLKTWKPYQKRRYGGLSFGDVGSNFTITNSTVARDALERILTAANNGTPISVGNITFLDEVDNLLPRLAVRDAAKVWFNNKGWAASVSYINVMNNLILRSNLPSDVDPADYGITAINHPMAMTKEQLNDEALYNSFKDMVIAICVMFAMSFIPASFTMYLIEERTSNSKHLQFVSGVKPPIYWFSNFFWDMLNFLIPALLCIIIFLIFDKRAYVSEVNLPVLVSLLFLYGWAMVPMMYPFSRLFNVPSTALVVLQSVNIFLGTVSTMATFIIEFLQEDDEELRDINKILMKVFLLMPQYCLGRGLFDMAKNQLFADVYARFEGINRLPNPFDWDQVGRNLFCMFMMGILFFIINLLFEYNFFIRSRQLKPKSDAEEDDDEDVEKERRRVMSNNADDDILVLKELTKVYSSKGRKGNMTAVDRLCIGVPKGQCFGLLGVNGAGKTTTFKMLTGDEKLSKGNAYVNGNNILNNMVQVRRNIGYCPQFDALDPLLTGVEHLRFYARLRGIPEAEVKHVADWAIHRLGLLPHANKVSSAYSGGNKRKLSTAIALIGNPSIIFLDEPTTGMDPGARRFLWDCISHIVKDGRSVILTSHSMEECEALCGRLAIMVSGRFKCLGSIQHLKNRFGDGYTVIVRVSGEFPDLDPAMEFFRQEFPNSVLKEKHHNMLQYQLGSNIKLSCLFGQIEAVRERLRIEDYSVSQTTLDQVFINFAKLQTDLNDDEMEEDVPDDLKYIAKSTAPSEFESQSLASSTAGLIQHEYRRGGGASKFVTYDDDDSSLQLTNIHRDQMVTKAILTRQPDGDAHIISLPFQDQHEDTHDIYSMKDEVSSYTGSKRGRPVTKFDDDSSNGMPDPVF